MHYFPIHINITEKEILIVGGGNVAFQKLKTLLKFTGKITVISENISEDIYSTGVTCIRKSFETNDLEGFDIIYAATDNKEVNELIFIKSRGLGSLVNVVDNPEISDFISPAVLIHNGNSISVGSDGKSPKKSVEIRNKIEQFLTGNQSLH